MALSKIKSSMLDGALPAVDGSAITGITHTPANNSVDETKVKDAFVGDFSDVTITAADTILYGDATDSGNTKKDTVQGILDLVSSGGFTPGCRVWMSGNQSITHSTFTKVNFNNESSSSSTNWDTDGDFDTSNNKFVVGSGDDGIYFVHAAIYWANMNDQNIGRTNIRVSGNANTQTYWTSANATTQTSICTGLFKLTAAQYLEVFVYHNQTGGTETIQGDERACYFCVQRIA